jgi:hypothetical protein
LPEKGPSGGTEVRGFEAFVMAHQGILLKTMIAYTYSIVKAKVAHLGLAGVLFQKAETRNEPHPGFGTIIESALGIGPNEFG